MMHVTVRAGRVDAQLDVPVHVQAKNVKLRFCRQRQVSAAAADSGKKEKIV